VVLAHELAQHPMHLIVGILANKDADGIMAALSPHALSLTFVPVPEHDSHDPALLAARWGGRAADSLDSALAVSVGVDGVRTGETVIVGSLYLAGVALLLNATLPD